MKVIFLALLLGGCASMGTVTKAGPHEGIQRMYSEPTNEVTNAALSAVASMPVIIKSIKSTTRGYEILFAKPASVYSWGEVGLVLVTELNGCTAVNIVTKKRYRLQMAGMSQAEFADQIFAAVDARL